MTTFKIPYQAEIQTQMHKSWEFYSIKFVKQRLILKENTRKEKLKQRQGGNGAEQQTYSSVFSGHLILFLVKLAVLLL